MKIASLTNHNYSVHEDTASLHNSAKSNEGEVLPASVRHVEDESAEWAGLDYKIKVTS